VIELDHRRVLRGGEEVHLSPKEYGVLAELAKRPDRIVGHAQLLRDVWGPAHEDHVEYLRIVIRNLRQKLERDPARPVIIRNEIGVGYRLSGVG
jgi:two-component system KDP operon response regulator KdpE